MLLGKKNDFEDGFTINVLDMLFPEADSYISNSLGHVSPRKGYVHYALTELNERYDIDTIIDVHTHPFCAGQVHFSGIDDNDEKSFLRFLKEHFDWHYASIVLSQTEYSARLWEQDEKGRAFSRHLSLKAMTLPESITNSGLRSTSARREVESAELLNRTGLALGFDNLSRIANSSRLAVIGMGGLGSIIAENLVHMGFHDLVLIDHDALEVSNLNRVVGGTFDAAAKQEKKVDVVRRHLQGINPNVVLTTFCSTIEDVPVDSSLINVDWFILATDNHSSRFYIQELAFKYFIPFISAGVAITVQDGQITDYSGEVIVVRPGDNLCLNCLGRLNPTKIASERHFNAEVRDKIVERGYVHGMDVKEPAVKTLNSVLGSIAVEELVNQYTNRSRDYQVTVYERNRETWIYQDVDSIRGRNKHCATCGIGT